MNGNQELWIMAHYYHEPPVYSLRYHNWARVLKKRGYIVTIFTSSAFHDMPVNRISTKSVTHVESIYDSIRYVYVRTRNYAGNGLNRVLNMVDYALRISMVTKNYRKPSAIIVVSPNILAPLAAISIGKRLNVPVISDIVDLWPEVIVEYFSLSKRNPIVMLLYSLEKWIYTKSDALIFSMEGGREYITDKGWHKKIKLDKVFYVNMGIDLQEFDECKSRFCVENEYLENKSIFKVIYTGAIRKVNHVKSICDCARVIKDKGYIDIKFIIYGNGTQLDHLKQYCSDNDINNVIFCGHIMKNYIPYILSKANVCIFNGQQKEVHRKYGLSPNKLFEYLASGKPILSNVNTKFNLITKYNCGIVTSSDDIKEYVNGVIQLYKMSEEERVEIGTRSRQAAKDYDCHKIIYNVAQAIEYAHMAKK